jgi:hypothetical protein
MPVMILISIYEVQTLYNSHTNVMFKWRLTYICLKNAVFCVVALVITEVSEEFSASIIRVTRIGLGTT